jgi:thioredoxin-dependent peroxiredoxin
MRAPQAGELAPDFELSGVPAGEYRLSAQRGKRVVLAFYPGDFTPVCTQQLSSYAANFDTFEETGAVLWGISVDDLEKHERFAKARALGFPLLSDPNGAVSKLYGSLGMLGRSRRTVFIVDENGMVVWRADEPLSLTYRELDQIVERLHDMGLVRRPPSGPSEAVRPPA